MHLHKRPRKGSFESFCLMAEWQVAECASSFGLPSLPNCPEQYTSGAADPGTSDDREREGGREGGREGESDWCDLEGMRVAGSKGIYIYMAAEFGELLIDRIPSLIRFQDGFQFLADFAR